MPENHFTEVRLDTSKRLFASIPANGREDVRLEKDTPAGGNYGRNIFAHFGRKMMRGTKKRVLAFITII